MKKILKSALRKAWSSIPSYQAVTYRPNTNRYLFLPINGVGLGHLTRALAVAKRLREATPSAEIAFLTTSIGVPLVHRAGFHCHHIPPAGLAGKDVTKAEWNRLFFKGIENVLALYKPGVLVFDGSAPYVGLQRIIRSYRRIRYAWIKRGLYKTGVNQDALLEHMQLFDLVITPSELGDASRTTGQQPKVVQVPPISLLDPSELLDRSAARSALRLSSDSKCAYVQLGAGNINGIVDMQDQIVRTLKEIGFQVVLGQSPISLQATRNTSADQVIIEYPNSVYFNAFDLAVLAGGYNSVCEAVYLGLASIFVPNTATGADDQLARVREAVKHGPYAVLKDFSPRAFREVVSQVIAHRPCPEKNAVTENGAMQAALAIRKLVDRAQVK